MGVLAKVQKVVIPAVFKREYGVLLQKTISPIEYFEDDKEFCKSLRRKVIMLVSEVMTREVVTVTPEETLAELVNKLVKRNYHILPVVDGENQVMGVVNFQDIMKVFLPHHPSLGKLLKSTHLYRFEEEDILDADLSKEVVETTTVADIMNHNAVTIEDHSTIAEVRHAMKMHNVVRMPVVSGGRLVGFVTLFDLIVALFRERGVIE